MSQESDSYRLLIKNMSDAFAKHRIILDNEGSPVDYEFIDVNAAFEEMTDLSGKEIIGKKITEVLPGIKESDFDWIGTYGKVALTGKSTSFKQYSEPLERWYEVTAYSNEPGYFVVIFRDITDRTKQSDYLQQSKTYLTEVLNNLTETILIADYEGRYVDMNPAASALLGYSREELLNLSIYNITADLNHETVKEKWQAYIKEGYQTGEYSIKRKDGSNIIAEYRAVANFLPGLHLFLISDITERKQAEQKIEEGHQSLLTVLENIEALIYVADMETHEILFINQHGRKNFGDVVGRKCWKILQEGQTGPCEFCTNDKLLDDTGQPTGVYQWEVKNTKNDRWFDCRDIAIRWIDGRMVRMEMVADITELKQAQEEELKVYEQIVSSSNDLMSLVDREYRYRIVNKPYTIMSNLKKDEIIGRHVSEINGIQVFHNTIKPMLDRCFAGENINYAAWFDFPGKGRRYLDVTYSPCYSSEATKIIGASVVSRDITERKQVEDALNESKKKLQASEENYRLLADNTPDHIYSLDREFRFTSVNQSLCQTLGLEAHEIIGRNHHELGFPGELVQEWQQSFRKAFKTGKAVETETTTPIPAGGTIHTYEFVLIPVFDENGMVTSIRGTSRDITERKALEHDILKADKLESIGLLAGGIAHDFNNLLAAILGNISLSLENTKKEDKTFKRLKNAEKAILQANELTKQLQTFAKGGDPVKTTISIEELLEEVVSFVLSGSNAQCQFSFPDDLSYVDIDAGQITQVIHNLAINALHAMPDGGLINVSAENVYFGNGKNDCAFPLEKGPYVKVLIQDSGIGIEKKNLQKIFDPFFSTKIEGSGLGLATSYSIVKRHGGCIKVESEPGEGTVFSIYLPASSKKAPVKKKGNRKISRGSGRILVMDDEESIIYVLGEMLAYLGCQVDFAREGSEAIEKYKESMALNTPYDMVILDLTIPGGMGGIQAMSILKNIDPQIKGIVSTGYSEDLAVANCKNFGFKGFILKPYTIEQLSEVLNENLGG